MSHNPQITKKEKKYVERKEQCLDNNGELDVIVSSLRDVGAFQIGLTYLNNQR